MLPYFPVALRQAVAAVQAYSYQWQYSADNSNFFNISGATGINYSPGAVGTINLLQKKSDLRC